ncbi:MAG: PASTA domain-containing protein [Erysipelotrichaceae bacterium]|nr:PASTA domain-containing protein [Erysipelotrichaceae bacterium]
MKNNTTKILLIITGILGTFVVAALAFLFFSPQLKAEDFVNKNIAEVIAWQEKHKVKSDKIEILYEFSETIEKDIVISQSIEKNKPIKQKISFTVSKGSDPDKLVDLIDFKDKTEAEITAWFKEQLFTDVTVEYIPHQEIAKGKFVKLNITGNQAKRSEVILVSISAGTDSVGLPIIIPDFKDFTKENIQAWAKTNNMSVSFTSEASDSISEGKVVSQNPKANEASTTGSKVKVVLSSGKGIVLENFNGKEKAALSKWAKANKISVTFVDSYSPTVASGLIISTNPKANSKIKPNSKLTAYISIGFVPLNNYVGKSKADFESYIAKLNKSNNESANISVEYINEVNNKVAENNIISMIVDGKEIDKPTTKLNSIKPGSKIKIKVSKGQLIKVDSYVNKPENEFITFLKKQGLVPNKTGESYSSYAKDNIVTNVTGEFKKGSSINYTTSKGAYKPDLAQYNNQTEEAARTTLATYNNQGANFKLTVDGGDFNDTVAANLLYDCKVTGNTISCKKSKGAGIVVGNYIGSQKPCANTGCSVNGLKFKFVSETNWSSKPKDEVVNQSIASGTKVAINTEITLTLSRGQLPINVSDFNNKTKEQANQHLATLNNQGAGLTLNFVDEYSDTVASGITYDCSISGKSVSCKASLGKKPVEKITIIDVQIKIVNSTSADESKTIITNYLKSLGVPDSQIQIELVHSDENVGQLVGDYPGSGDYDPSTVFKFQISKGPQ